MRISKAELQRKFYKFLYELHSPDELSATIQVGRKRLVRMRKTAKRIMDLDLYELEKWQEDLPL